MVPKDLNAERLAQMDLDDFRPIAMLLRGRTFITAIRAEGSGIEGFWLDAADDEAWAEGEQRISDLNAQGWNIYFSPNPPRSDFSGAKPKLADIPEIQFLQVDLDPDDVAGLGHPLACAKAKNSAQRFSKTYLPNIAINSGNGFQLFWMFSKPVDVKTAIRLNKKLAHAADQMSGISCSGTWNPDRIMRVAGTLNWPTGPKLRRGYPEEPTQASCLGVVPERELDVEAIDALSVPPEKYQSAATGTNIACHLDCCLSSLETILWRWTMAGCWTHTMRPCTAERRMAVIVASASWVFARGIGGMACRLLKVPL
ncbi:hypothetical protein K3727_04040 [Rhodobacteraceae bacterium M382]|nr:hypothetical protein K3727_04040 [Rhodobacteraceae bacterium M382]